MTAKEGKNRTEGLVGRSKSQTLITGVYRTGTEYIAQLIGCHPRISVTMYTVNLLRFVYRRFDPIDEKANYTTAVDSIADRVKERYNRTVKRDEILETLDGADVVTYGLLYDVVMASMYMKGDEEHWAEKVQLLWREIPDFIDMMPNGKAILVLRDPRSVLVSFKNFTTAPEPAYLGAVFNCLDSMQLAREYKERYSEDRFLCLRYEDVMRSEKDTVERVWDFIGTSADVDTFDRSGWKDAYGEAWHANSSFHDNTDKRNFDKEASIKRWHGKLSMGELSLVEGVCGDVMEEFGYEVEASYIDWSAAKGLFEGDEAIMRHYKCWLDTGSGIEAFPTDPLKSENWWRNYKTVQGPNPEEVK